MGDLLSPCNFANIQGDPHAIPEKSIEKLPSFQGNDVISVVSHILNFNLCVNKWSNGHNHEDIKMTLLCILWRES
jgi:hypothetical protein